MKALLALPDPSVAPDRWTERSLELRNLATIEGRCFVCGAGAWYAGVDHREIGHTEFRHADGCRCSDESIRKHLRHRGLQMEEERYLLVEADIPEDHWAARRVAS